MSATAWRKKAEQVAAKIGVDVMFFPDEHIQTPFEDDGNLHIIKHGLRACFGVGGGDDDDGSIQNERTRAIMAHLRLKVTDRVLIEEDDDEDDVCPHCGR